jgi:hypothetical protein
MWPASSCRVGAGRCGFTHTLVHTHTHTNTHTLGQALVKRGLHTINREAYQLVNTLLYQIGVRDANFPHHPATTGNHAILHFSAPLGVRVRAAARGAAGGATLSCSTHAFRYITLILFFRQVLIRNCTAGLIKGRWKYVWGRRHVW